MDENSRGIIKAGIRTLLNLFPGLSGFAQAWSEYDNTIQNMRIEEFFAKTSERLQKIESELGKYSDYFSRTKEIPYLLEKTIQQYCLEPLEVKRNYYISIFISLITEKSSSSFNEKVNYLYLIENLNEYDIEVLRRFYPDKNLRVEKMMKTKNDQKEFAELILSLGKLESRVLISETQDNINLQSWAGDRNNYVNRWNLKHYTIMKFGVDLVDMLT